MNTSSLPRILTSAAVATPANDCNCACPQVRRASDAAPLAHATLVQLHPEARRMALTDEYTLVFVPSVSGVAVLNSSALDVFERLRTPQTLAHLEGAELEVAQSLYDMGVLYPFGTTPEPPAPADELVAWMHVTNACNLRCSYCYLAKTEEAMSPETAQAAIGAVFRSAQLHNYRRVLLKYAGGEATLNLPLVEQMHADALARGAAAGIAVDGVVLSNGVGLSARRLKQIHDAGLRLMISLDGPQAFHDAQRPTVRGQGTYAAVVASIERAAVLGLDLTVSVTITGASVGGVPEIARWLLERGVHFSLNFYRENDCSASFAQLRNDEQRLIDGMRACYKAIEANLPSYSLLGCLLDRANLLAPHRHTCAAGENYLVIDHHGRIAKCQMEIDRPVASIDDADPLHVLRLDPRGMRNPPVEQKTGCRECQWRYWCTGGCAVATFRATGRYDIQSPNCGIYQALFPDVLRLEGLRMLRAADVTSMA